MSASPPSPAEVRRVSCFCGHIHTSFAEASPAPRAYEALEALARTITCQRGDLVSRILRDFCS
jgi:hypothetical protein